MPKGLLGQGGGFGPSTVSDIGGAVSYIFGAFGAETSADLKARGLDIQAQGTRISAQSLLLKSQGDLAEASQYDLAQALATQNANYTKASTAISAAQQDRQITMTIGGEKAAVGGSGLAESGTALDLLRDSASQGALARATLVTQGQIVEAGFEEQAKSFAVMSAAARQTAAGEAQMSGEEQGIATQQEQLAADTRAAGRQAATGDFISGALKGVAAIATLALAPATGGASLAALGPALTSLGDGSGVY
jgi:hypothetical protein